MSKYTLARQSIDAALAAAEQSNVSAADLLEALIVLSIADLAQCAGGKRAADVLRYELSNVGGDVDTVFLRSR
jgi:hypothetical protein